MGLEDDPFLLGPGLFSGAFAVSFRESSIFRMQNQQPYSFPCFEPLPFCALELALSPKPLGGTSNRFLFFVDAKKHIGHDGIDISHTIHGIGISTYIWLKSMVNVGKYTSPMDSMGIETPFCFIFFSGYFEGGKTWQKTLGPIGPIGDFFQTLSPLTLSFSLYVPQ